LIKVIKIKSNIKRKRDIITENTLNTLFEQSESFSYLEFSLRVCKDNVFCVIDQ